MCTRDVNTSTQFARVYVFDSHLVDTYNMSTTVTILSLLLALLRFSFVCLRSLILRVSLLFSIVAVFGAAYADDRLDRTSKVSVAPVVRSNAGQPIHMSGKLTRKTTVRLAFNIDGLVDSVSVDKGDILEKGQLLATLDSREIQARVKRFQSSYQTALNDWVRNQDLHSKNMVSLSELQHSKNNMESAEASLQIALFDNSLSKIYSPIGGEVIERFVEEDELVAARQTAFVVAADRDGWVVNVDISDRDVVRLKLGDSAKITLGAYKNRVFSGTVTEISAQADEDSNLFQVEVALEGSLDNFRTGYLASVDIQTTSDDQFTYIPMDALVEIKDSLAVVFAYSTENRRVKRIVLPVAFLQGNNIVTHAMLEEHRYVVVRGASYLSDGEAVNIDKSTLLANDL